MSTVNASKPVPLYWQVSEEIRRMINEGTLKAGDKIPTEAWLQEQYQVSRVTVRKAIQLLLDQNILYRVHGESPTVAVSRVNRQTSRLSGLSADLKKMGYTPSSLILCCEETKAPFEVAEAMKLQPNAPVYHLMRLRLADGVPLALHNCYYPMSRCRYFLSPTFHSSSVYQLLEEHGLRPTHATQTVSARNATSREAQLLSIEENSALLYIVRVSTTPDLVPIEYSEMFYNPMRYVLNMELDC